MRDRAITTVLLAVVLGVGATACSAQSSHPAVTRSATPTASTPTAATPTATTSTAGSTGSTPPPAPMDAAMARCVAVLETNPTLTAPPQECASLSQEDYLKAMRAASDAARNKLASATASGKP